LVKEGADGGKKNKPTEDGRQRGGVGRGKHRVGSKKAKPEGDGQKRNTPTRAEGEEVLKGSQSGKRQPEETILTKQKNGQRKKMSPPRETNKAGRRKGVQTWCDDGGRKSGGTPKLHAFAHKVGNMKTEQSWTSLDGGFSHREV